MADKKTETNKLEREYVIPLRSKWKRVPRYKRANKAIKAIKEFLVKHMKVRDRDLKKIKIDKYLNEEVWFRGIKKPPARIKVKAIKEKDIVKVELSEMPKKLKFKKAREEKREQKAAEIAEGKVKATEKEKTEVEKKGDEKTPQAYPEKSSTKISTKDKEEAKEKKSAVVEAGQKMEKENAKKVKHQTKQSKQPKHQQRKALAK
jgi:large subunit ribosomal protein L31e